MDPVSIKDPGDPYIICSSNMREEIGGYDPYSVRMIAHTRGNKRSVRII
jgi:hypothetical protein